MARKGERWIDGRLYLLAWRHTGLDAQEQAAAHAKRLRLEGKLVRVVKASRLNVAVYSF